MRINKELSVKREQYAHGKFSLDPPASVSDVQADLKNPANDLGGFEMSNARIYEIQELAKAKQPLPEKVFTRKVKTRAIAKRGNTRIVGHRGGPRFAIQQKKNGINIRFLRW